MNNLYTTTAALGLAAGSFMMGAEAEAAPVSFNFDVILTEAGTTPVAADVFVQFDTGITGTQRATNFIGFDLLDFSVSWTGGSNDGIVQTSANATGQITQDGRFSRQNALIDVFDPVSRTSLSLTFASTFTDVAILAEIDPNALIFGMGYGVSDTILSVDSVTSVDATIPLPASGALLALTAGGAALVGAAKRRRAAKRAAKKRATA